MIHYLKVLFGFVSIFVLSASLNANDIKSKILYAKYIDVPKVVYTKQKFQVDISIKVLLPKTTTFSISTDISNNRNITQITEDIIWYKKDDNTFETTIKYKIFDKKFNLPRVDISILGIDNTVLDKVRLKKTKVTYRKIAINQKNYSNVIATEVNINTTRTKQYTNNQLLALLEIQALNSNLEDFHLSLYDKQGIKDIVVQEDSQVLYYYVIIPMHTKEIKFDYYNSKLDEFIKLTVPINLKEELVSTQTDLNPFESSLLKYKLIALSVVALIFLMIYFFNKKTRYLFIAILFVTFITLPLLPNKKMFIQKDINIYILPTSNSIIYKKTHKKEEVSILHEKEKFTKVLFDNNTLGWIKND